MATEWRESTWGDEISLEYGKALRDYDTAGGKFRVFGSNGPIGWTTEPLAPGPGVILGRKGAYRGVEFSREPFFVIDTAYYVVPKTELDMRWLYYAIKHHKLGEIDDGSPIPSTTRAAVYVKDLQIPPITEQNAIALALGALDDKIELNRRMNETLEALAESLFKSWFVDAAQSALPNGWRWDKLGELLSVIETGGRPRGGVSDITEGVPSVGAESIVGIGHFDYAKTKFVPREFFQSMNKGHVRDGDVLLYKDGGRPGEFEPHVTMVGDGFPFSEFSINEHVYRLRTEPNLPQSFLYFWLSSDSAMDEMRNRGTGVAIPGLNSTQVRELAVLRPPTDVVKKFEQVVSPLIHRIFANCNESRTLAALRDALLPKLLSGKLRVPAAAKFTEARA